MTNPAPLPRFHRVRGWAAAVAIATLPADKLFHEGLLHELLLWYEQVFVAFG